MRYAIISDIHGNLHAMESVAEDIAQRNIDLTICLGDIIGYGPKPQETADLVRSVCRYFIMGNHDAVIAGYMDPSLFNPAACFAIEWTARQLNEETIAFIRDMPFELDGSNFACCHGEFMVPSRYGYILTSEDAIESFAANNKHILFTGHSHVPLYYTMVDNQTPEPHKPSKKVKLDANTRYIFNVGSVGQSRDSDLRSCYCIYDSEAETIEYIRVAYDIDRTRSEMILAEIPLSPAIFRAVPPIEEEEEETQSIPEIPIEIDDFTPLTTALSVKERRAQFILESEVVRKPIHFSLVIMIVFFAVVLGWVLYANAMPKTQEVNEVVESTLVDDTLEMVSYDDLKDIRKIKTTVLNTDEEKLPEIVSPKKEVALPDTPKTVVPPKVVERLKSFYPAMNTATFMLNVDSIYNLPFNHIMEDSSLWAVTLSAPYDQRVVYNHRDQSVSLTNEVASNKIKLISAPIIGVATEPLWIDVNMTGFDLDSESIILNVIDVATNLPLQVVNMRDKLSKRNSGSMHHQFVLNAQSTVSSVRLSLTMGCKGALKINTVRVTYPQRVNPPLKWNDEFLKQVDLSTTLPEKLLTSSMPEFNMKRVIVSDATQEKNWTVSSDNIEFKTRFGKDIAFKNTLTNPMKFDARNTVFTLPAKTVQLRLRYTCAPTPYTGTAILQIVVIDEQGRAWNAVSEDLTSVTTGKSQSMLLKNIPANSNYKYLIRIFGDITGELKFTEFVLERI